MLFVCHPKILHKHCFQFLLGPFYLQRETEDTLWYFLEWSISLATSPLVSLRNDGTSDEFHTDDASWRRSGYCFVSNFLQPIRSTTQIWVAVSDTSSIWNFWARSSDVILKGNQRSGIAKCFSGEPKIISELQLIVGRVILLLSSNSA